MREECWASWPFCTGRATLYWCVSRRANLAFGALTGCITDIKPSSVLVNYRQGEIRFSDVQLADFGSTVHMSSPYARNGDSIGTSIFRSPEAQLHVSGGQLSMIHTRAASLSLSAIPSYDVGKGPKHWWSFINVETFPVHEVDKLQVRWALAFKQQQYKLRDRSLPLCQKTRYPLQYLISFVSPLRGKFLKRTRSSYSR